MKRIDLLILITICFLCTIFSCSNYKGAFESLVKNNEIDVFPSLDLGGVDNIENNHYKIIYNSGKKANSYLISKLASTKKTNWWRAPMPVQLTEGDIALIMLMDVNKIEFNKLLPVKLEKEYKFHGALCWWHWLHENSNNRDQIIEIVKDEINY